MISINPLLLSLIGAILTAALSFLGVWSRTGNIVDGLLAALPAFIGAMTTGHQATASANNRALIAQAQK
jgi:hypothetical protein